MIMGAAKQIVDALLHRFLPLASRRIDTAQAQDGQYLRASDPAYEQVLDSLAMAAQYTPLALLEALTKWRDSESPKGANDASTFQRKLAVECIFCSACIRLVECCPHEGLPEASWKQLESFVFDWLINADRVVSQAEYPSLVDLRGLLLDLVAQLLGALSIIRFSSVTERFFLELNTRRNESNVARSEARSEALSIIHGMRYLKLGVTTAGGLGASTSFVGKANPLLRTPMKKKTELHHALCNMLSNILAPLADAGKGQWPPKGVDTTLALWYESVYRIRNGLLQWMERQSKHFIVGYPLVTLLLCLGDPQSFQDQFESHLENLHKHLREKNLRSMALDCLHRVVRFYLNVYSEKQSRNQVWDYLHRITSQLLALVKKGGSLMQDVHQDKLVEFCLTIAERNLDFAMNHMILELLRTENLSEAKVIGLRSLLAVVSPPSHRRAGSVDFRGEESHLAVSSSLRGSSFISWSSSASGSPLNTHSGRVQVGTGFSNGAHDISHYMPKVREALDHIIRTCHSAYGAARLTSSKSTLEPKSQGWPVFKWALKCIPSLLPDIWKNDRMTEILPSYGISIEPGVREEAVRVLFRTVHYQPQSRSAVMKGMAKFILQLPDEFPLLIHTSLGRLVQLLKAWRACLAEESQYVGTRSFATRDNGDHSYKSPFWRSGDTSKFHPFGMDAIGLIFLCSVDVPTRLTALELLHCVRALQNEIRRYSLKESGKRLQRQDAEPTFVIDVFEEAGEDIVKHCYWDPGRWYDLKREWEVVPSDCTLQSILESHDKGKWARCLSELVKHAALLCPEAVDAARLEVVQRLANMTPSDLGGKGCQTQDFESKLEQWSNYTMFACSCPPENSDDGGTQAAKDLFHMIFPLLKSNSEAQTFAATQTLGHVHSELLETMLSSRLTFLEDSATEVESRSKWKSQKPRQDDVRMHVANVFRIAAENIWPGLLPRKPVLRIHFANFIEETSRHLTSTFSTQPESFQELQPLRFCLASVIRSLAPELVKGNSERFDPKTRKRLFDLLLAWCDDTVVPWAQDTVGDYRREIERYKSSQNTRSKDSMERINLEREVSDQVEVLQWVAMNAMAALLYGPCFDDNARKMSGRIISWINTLFLDPSSRVFGYSPADSRAPLQSKFSSTNNFENLRNAAANKDRLRGIQFRAQLAKTALFNLLQTNLDLFPVCIDQCYSSDSLIADGYFSVLAEVYMRQELPRCEIQRLLSLILYKVVDPSRQIRDDALQMLETLSAREWAEEGEGVGSGRYRAAVVGNLPDSYQQFQYQLSAKLAREHPELSELLCEEIMQRQLDAVDIIAQHQVLTCMAPWIENLQLWKHSGWCERLLKSMYYVTWRHGDQFPDEIEQLWITVAKKVKNISPVLDFLIVKGIEDCDSNATGEISGAFATYFSVAKRISLYLARVSPQQTIDHLVYELAQRMAEDQPEQQLKRSLDSVLDFENFNQVLEFSQGPMQVQVLDPPPPTSPLFVRSSLEGGLRNVSGSLSWRTATGRSTSGPLNNMPLPDIHTGRSGQLFTASGPLPALSAPLMGVRTSTGSIKSRHLSRDSGDYFVETPHSNEDMRSTTSAADMQSALQVHHHWLLKADIALILLTEIAYENDEDFRGHLPLLFHVTFVSMDSSEDIVLEHCQQLLVNLLYSLAGRPLESYSVGGDYGDAAYKQQVESLVKYVQSKKGRMMWENEDMSLTRIELPSATLLSALVQSVVDAIFFQGDLRERWGEEALKWAMECSSRHLAGRSHQIYRALHPPVTSDTCISLLRCLHRCFSNPSPAVLGFIMEILLTLQVIVENMEAEKVILYPQLFWACVAMLHTDFVHVYTQVLELFSRVIDRLLFRDQTVENVLLSNMPRDELEHEKDMGWVVSKGFEMGRKSGGHEVVKAPMFEGVQPLVLKGVMSTVSHASAIEVLSRITVNSCDCIFGNSETRLLMHIIGMLPWLCLQLHKEHSIVLSGSFDSPLQQQYQKACSVAANISHWCEAKDFNDLASIFYAYSEGNVATMESLLDQVSPHICAQWFPRHSPLAFGHLLRLLEKGPVEYHTVILLLLRSLLQYTQMDPSQSPQVYAVITQFVESDLCREALKVLEALLQSCSNCGGQQEDRSEKAAVVTLVSQSSFKSRSGPLHYSAGSGGAIPFSHGSTDMLPSRETALQNTRLTLDRVLDTYGPGKRRDYKRRLVPFVASSTQLNTGAQHVP